MTFRDVLLVLHIAGAGTWFGSNVVQAVVPPMAARGGTSTLASWYRITSGMLRIYIQAAILVLVTGVFLVLENDSYGFGSPFVAVGLGMIVIGLLLGQFVFGPGGEAAADAVESGDEPAIRASVGRLTRFGLLDTVLLLLTITVMVLRWT